MDDNDAMAAALQIERKLEAALEDFSAEDVVLSRDEAILTLGMIRALIEAMDNAAVLKARGN